MLQKLRRGNNQKGFTLIELMIVIAIIGILAAIAIPNFLSYRTKGQDTAAVSAAKNFYNMAMAYYADGNTGDISAVDGAMNGGYNPGADVLLGGTITDTGGTITVTDLTFKHSASDNVQELDASGNVTTQ